MHPLGEMLFLSHVLSHGRVECSGAVGRGADETKMLNASLTLRDQKCTFSQRCCAPHKPLWPSGPAASHPLLCNSVCSQDVVF